MGSILWAGLFLVFTVVGAAVGCAVMIGMPIAAELTSGLVAMAALLGASGTMLFFIAPSAAPDSREPGPAHFHHA